jgi:hypothetical protein
VSEFMISILWDRTRRLAERTVQNPAQRGAIIRLTVPGAILDCIRKSRCRSTEYFYENDENNSRLLHGSRPVADNRRQCRR